MHGTTCPAMIAPMSSARRQEELTSRRSGAQRVMESGPCGWMASLMRKLRSQPVRGRSCSEDS
jgi:hypothetical protein